MGKLENAFDASNSRVLLERDLNLSEAKPEGSLFKSSDGVRLEQRLRESERKYKELYNIHKQCLLELEKTKEQLEKSQTFIQLNKLLKKNADSIKKVESDLNRLKNKFARDVEEVFTTLNEKFTPLVDMMRRAYSEVEMYRESLLASIDTADSAHSIFLQVSFLVTA
eukprot:TRINITY_DN15510_c0_g5_i2.p2 TRINITY_DN15510_c0_g5~~TRINITY_DN15510_c0_g5_i2.p2  ORF type:complete len:167 (-),score=32.92 TRINITY_DN15510_c0_g5_i2:352-852(-)